MIYMEPVSLGWEPLLQSWLNTLPETLSSHTKLYLKDMFLRFCPAFLHFIRRCGVKVITILCIIFKFLKLIQHN